MSQEVNMKELISRINELTAKAKASSLSQEELAEREKLRTIYRQKILGQVSGQLSNMSIRNLDGTITKVKPKDNTN